MQNLSELKIAIVGLGYVGLPLAVEFGKQFDTLGMDINAKRIDELKQGIDRSLEVTSDELKQSTKLRFTSKQEELKGIDIFIVTVPTPIDEYKRPDLTPLVKSSETVGKNLSKNAIVIYESTVYPGATEEVCVPILEKFSGLKFNTDFFCGYSPERINPGDKEHRVVNIKKITSGSTPKTADTVDALYNSIVRAGTHKASSIKVAEAAKVIENTQRDVNIALINELAILFGRLGLNTLEVLEAAGSKWNFLPFRPGLVGGHCIGVDPYYLTHKAQEVGHHPEMILAGRRTNDGMGEYIAHQIVKLMVKKSIPINNSRILVMGLTFKENCPDIRNTKVTDIINELKTYNAQIDIYDPWANSDEVSHEYSLELQTKPSNSVYDAVVVAVAHKEFRELGVKKIRSFLKPNGVIYDIKYLFAKTEVDAQL